jgi:hypothetical protein
MHYNNEYNAIFYYVKGKAHSITGHEDPERVQV